MLILKTLLHFLLLLESVDIHNQNKGRKYLGVKTLSGIGGRVIEEKKDRKEG